LEKCIIKTITYYNELDYPLTDFEIWKHLIDNENKYNKDKMSYNFLVIIKILENKDLYKYIEEFEGFYFLKGRSVLVEKRLKKNKIAVAKIKKLRNLVWILRLIPFIRMIGVTGTLAMKNTGSGSDWDLLIVLKSGRIWIGRTLITGFTHILGKRRHGEEIKNRICLNYFLTDKSLEIRNKDLFSASEYSFIFPILDTGIIFRKFQLANRWIANYKPNYSIAEIINSNTVADSWFSRNVRKFGEIIFNINWLENKLRNWEQEKIKNNPKTSQEGSYIEASDKALIFLPDPQGPKVFEGYKKSIEKLSIL
jgi:hypothetical protein